MKRREFKHKQHPTVAPDSEGLRGAPQRRNFQANLRHGTHFLLRRMQGTATVEALITTLISSYIVHHRGGSYSEYRREYLKENGAAKTRDELDAPMHRYLRDFYPLRYQFLLKERRERTYGAVRQRPGWAASANDKLNTPTDR